MYEIVETFVVVFGLLMVFAVGLYFILEAINGFIFEASRAIRRWRRGNQ